ncbi:hypothetical protein Tco_0732104 [Tanacetum coccineum]
MPKVEKYVTESLGAEVLVRSTNQPQTSYAVASLLSEIELKKILIDKMEANKSIDISDVQKNLYNALVEAYNSEKDIISSYGDVVTLKRGRDDKDKDEEPSAGSDRGLKRRRSSKEAESPKEPTQKETKLTTSSKVASRSQPRSLRKSAHVHDGDERQWNPPTSLTPNHEWHKIKTINNRPLQPWITQLAQAAGTQSSFDQFLATPIDFSAFIMNQLKIDNLTQDVLTGPTYDLMKGSCKSVVELKYHLEEVFKANNDQLDWNNPEGRSLKTRFLEEYGVRKESFTTSMLTRVTNLNLDERYVLNVALRMYTRRIVIQERVEDLQLGVESYQKKINLSRPDTYCSDLRKMTPYIAYPDIQGIIYQDDMDKNRLMRSEDKNHFALNDIATGIQMEYLPKRK